MDMLEREYDQGWPGTRAWRCHVLRWLRPYLALADGRDSGRARRIHSEEQPRPRCAGVLHQAPDKPADLFKIMCPGNG
jgi:hypothetical protein